MLKLINRIMKTTIVSESGRYHKSFILFVAFLIMSAANSFSQMEPPDTSEVVRYGFSIRDMRMSNGIGHSFVSSVTVEKGRKLLKLGAVLQNENQIFSGFSASYKVMLGRTNENGLFKSKDRVLNPFIFYNFNYFSMHYKVDDHPELIRLNYNSGESVRKASHEHYLGLGVKINFDHIAYLDLGYAIGRYLGATGIPKVEKNTIDPAQNSGFTRMFKISLGFKLYQIY